jgi:hypothetical protein
METKRQRKQKTGIRGGSCGIVAGIRKTKEVRSGSGRTDKEIIVAESPENPGSQGSPNQPYSSPAPPPFQPVSSGFQPVTGTSTATGGPAQPGAAPAKSGGSSALKIVLIIVAVFVVLVMMVVGVIGYGVYRVRKAIHVNQANGAMSVDALGVKMNADAGMKFTADELGTDPYPGAETAKSGNMRMNMAGNSVVSAAFLTSDSKEKVVEFYKDKLGSEATSMDFGANAILSLKKGEHEMVQVTISQEANQFDGKTQIHISHTTSSQAK